MRRALPLALLLSVFACSAPAVDDDDDSAPGPGPTVCEVLDLDARPWDAAGPYGTLRRDLMADFTIALEDEDDWVFSDQWSGCESYVFLPDDLAVHQTNNTSLWLEGVQGLVERSPDNVHYFFISVAATADGEDASTKPMKEAIDDYLGTLAETDADRAAWWSTRLHVARKRRASLDNDVETILAGLGRRGFAVDRVQQVRGVGSFADVSRYIGGDGWPWESNLAYAANEAQYFNFEANRQAVLDSQDAAGEVTEIEVWNDVILAEYEDTEVVFPDAATMATFDRLEFSIEAFCPDANALEPGNCGAWDYLGYVWLYDEANDAWLEMSRFITPYHREATYVLDGTHALPWLASGGAHTIRYSFAPPWNTQPTWTKFVVRLRDSGEPTPVASAFLFGGGGFGSTYNEGREPVTIEVPAGASRVEVQAIISGHGADYAQCAEFCNHQHEFTVDGEVYFHEHPEPGDQEGCSNSIEATGTVPNQSGTWWFGRGGWCPGRAVDPIVFDVTEHAEDGSVTVEYRGLFNGATPVDGSGNIEMRSWLVVYE